MAKTPTKRPTAAARKKRAATKTKTRSNETTKSVRSLKSALAKSDTAKKKRPGVEALGTSEPAEYTSARWWAECIDELIRLLVEYDEEAATMSGVSATTRNLIRSSLRRKFDKVREALTNIQDRKVPACLVSVLELARDVGNGGTPETLKWVIGKAHAEINKPIYSVVESFKGAVAPLLNIKWTDHISSAAIADLNVVPTPMSGSQAGATPNKPAVASGQTDTTVGGNQVESSTADWLRTEPPPSDWHQECLVGTQANIMAALGIKEESTFHDYCRDGDKYWVTREGRYKFVLYCRFKPRFETAKKQWESRGFGPV